MVFVIRAQEYYLSVWKVFFEAGMLDPLVAEVEGQMVAGLILFYLGKTAWYLYGMSTGQHRDKMPNNLLQWEAMRIAKDKGCQVYDLWGAPDRFDESDSMFGVFRFKEGLGPAYCVPVGPGIMWSTRWGIPCISSYCPGY